MSLDFIINKIIAYAPHLAIYAIIAVVVGVLVWKFSRFYWETSRNNALVPQVAASLQKIQTALNTLNNVLLEKSIISQSYFSQANSPRQVNEIGESLYQDSQAEVLYETLKDDLLEELEDNTEIDSLYELEQESLKVLLDRMNDEEFKNVQNFAFNNPVYKGKDLTYTDILYVMALKLREEYRKQHPELES